MEIKKGIVKYECDECLQTKEISIFKLEFGLHNYRICDECLQELIIKSIEYLEAK